MLGLAPPPLRVCAFRGTPRWQREGRPEPERNPPAPRSSPGERALCITVICMCCYIVVALFSLVILAHSPIIAN
ncbi:MAG: hypothetical protein OHK0029_18130 [Armatimonadaceae bacterium]